MKTRWLVWGSLGRGALACALVAWLSLPGSAFAQGERGTAAQFGLGTGVALVNMVYGPAKVFYALIGGLTAGFAYAVTGGRQEVALEILYPTMRGDYAVMPEHLLGQQPLRFSGLPPQSSPSY
jgi:hypothetical protein